MTKIDSVVKQTKIVIFRYITLISVALRIFIGRILSNCHNVQFYVTVDFIRNFYAILKLNPKIDVPKPKTCRKHQFLACIDAFNPY